MNSNTGPVGTATSGTARTAHRQQARWRLVEKCQPMYHCGVMVTGHTPRTHRRDGSGNPEKPLAPLRGDKGLGKILSRVYRPLDLR